MWPLVPIALRNVRRNARRTLITLLALLVGVGVMVSVRGLLNGLQAAMIDNVVLGQTGAVQVHRAGYMANVLASPLNLHLPADAAFLQKIKAIPHVTAAAPRILFGGMVNLDDETLFMATIAVDPAAESRVCPKRAEVIRGDGGAFLAGKVEAGAILSTELATGLAGNDASGKRKLDGQAALLAPDVDGALSGENLKIAGTMSLTSPGERKIGMVTLSLAQRLLKLDGRATEIAIAVDDVQHAPAVAEALRKALGPEFEVHTWDQAAPFFKDVMFNQNFVLQLVASVFLILMLLGVANTMLMSVLDRTREIGTMMAVGVRRARILVLFLIEAAAIGVLGGVVGGAVGIGVTVWLHERGLEIEMPVSSVPFVVRPFVTPEYLLQIVAIAGLGAVLFAVYPAWRASRLRPVEALAGG